jgi:hypothetical protein
VNYKYVSCSWIADHIAVHTYVDLRLTLAFAVLLPFSSLDRDHTLGSVLLIKYIDRNKREAREKKKEA